MICIIWGEIEEWFLKKNNMNAKFKVAKFMLKEIHTSSFFRMCLFTFIRIFNDIYGMNCSSFKTYLFTGPIDFSWWFLASDGSVKLVRKITAYQLKFHIKYMPPTFSCFNKILCIHVIWVVYFSILKLLFFYVITVIALKTRII